ncbi:hypothetical protein MTR67_014348 [Solanum verrucosum]|uniref:Uncharacterized protein n=1 Tax=Solanum verrucosum TaxID=315347 RepID=A0AAF0TMW6_SOLVR|nr:hypothetical protein MTR67_014348 [Solanum verrucosum]
MIEPDGSSWHPPKDVVRALKDCEKELGRTLIKPEVFKKTHVRKKENESDPDVWMEKRAEQTFIVVMSAQIVQLTSALAASERRRDAEQRSMSETVQQIKEQVMNRARRPTTSAPEDTDDDSDDEGDYVELTP